MATMIGDVSAETLTEDEALALGVSTIVHAGEIDPDNYAVNAALASAGVPQVDKEGRPIISFKQYEEIGRASGRVDGYALRVMRPGARGTWIVQASKYHKWFGLGYEAVGTPPERTHLAVAIREQVTDELKASVEVDDLDERQIARKIDAFIHKNSKAIAEEVAKRMGVAVPSRRPVRTVQPVEESADELVMFYCRDKYPECNKGPGGKGRVFDNQPALKLHWRKDHEGGFTPKGGHKEK